MKFKIFHDVSTKIFPYCWKKHPDLDANNTAGKAIVKPLPADSGRGGFHRRKQRAPSGLMPKVVKFGK